MNSNASLDSATALRRTVATAKRAFVAVLGFSLAVNVLVLTVPLFTLQTFDRVLSSGSVDTLLFLTIAAVLSLVVWGMLEATRSRLLVRIATWFEEVLGPSTFNRMFDAARNGASYVSESLRDLTTIRNFMGGSPMLALLDLPWMPIYMLVLFALHPMLGWVAVIASVLLLGLAAINEFATKKPLGEANMAFVRAMRFADQTVRNAETAEAMGMTRALLRRWNAVNRDQLALQITASDRAGSLLAISKAVRMLVQVGLLALGAWLFIQQEITSGAMIAASIITARALAPVEQAIGTWKQLIGARDAYRRVAEHLSAPGERIGGMPLPAPKGAVTVNALSYMPQGSEKPILHNVSFSATPGEIVAVIGPSGAGKSTLARVLVGAVPPTAGAVRIDGADIQMWDREYLGRFVGYVPQDIEMFQGTVAENIARMAELDAEAVVAAARAADVHEIVLALPSGYDTPIGPGDFALSGGQRQRVALARALHGWPKVVVLDEPDSHLDVDGEEALSKAILEAKRRGAAVFVIAHNPNMLRVVDKVLVLRGGTVEQFGPRDEVMAVLKAARDRALAAQDIPRLPKPQGAPVMVRAAVKPKIVQ